MLQEYQISVRSEKSAKQIDTILSKKGYICFITDCSRINNAEHDTRNTGFYVVSCFTEDRYLSFFK